MVPDTSTLPFYTTTNPVADCAYHTPNELALALQFQNPEVEH
jgi:hypothetical protein